jgi:hypothetical protein
MTSNSKKPGVAFWATLVVVVVLVGYPLSLGPVAWLHAKLDRPRGMKAVVAPIYAPIFWAQDNGPDWLRKSIDLYEKMWHPAGPSPID